MPNINPPRSVQNGKSARDANALANVPSNSGRHGRGRYGRFSGSFIPLPCLYQATSPNRSVASSATETLATRQRAYQQRRQAGRGTVRPALGREGRDESVTRRDAALDDGVRRGVLHLPLHDLVHGLLPELLDGEAADVEQQLREVLHQELRQHGEGHRAREGEGELQRAASPGGGGRRRLEQQRGGQAGEPERGRQHLNRPKTSRRRRIGPKASAHRRIGREPQPRLSDLRRKKREHSCKALVPPSGS
eukprot:1187289-Prorocentrum_minimum.AAC.3